MRRRVPVVLTMLVLLCAAPLAARAAGEVTVQVDATKAHQTVEGFGTMWTYWDWPAQYDDPAFFDRLVGDLGVGIVRVEIPASLEPANDDDDPNHYNWSAFNLGPDMDRLMRFCQECKKRGVTRFLGDTFSPPGFLKTNRAVNWGGSIRADMWDEYAEYMSAFIILAQKDYGINITDITIQNELLFIEWYASCVYHPQAAREAVRALMRKFKAENIHCNILMPEDMMYYDRMIRYIGPTMADPETKDFVGAFCTHREGGFSEVQRWYEATRQYGRESWMTETSGHPQNWTGAMKMASDIYDYTVGGNFSAWVYLRPTGPASNGDSLMIDSRPGPKYYAARQWYRYVRPGAVRVDAVSSDPNVLAAAFTHDVDGTLAIVLINRVDQEAKVAVAANGEGLPADYAVCRSSQNEGCAEVGRASGPGLSVTMPAKSIVTLYGRSPAMKKRQALPALPIAWINPNPADTSRWGSETPAPRPQIVSAAQSGDAARIQQELTAGADVNAADALGWTALHTAILEGNKNNVIDLLIQRGADVNRPARDGWTPLHMASASFHNDRYAIFQRIMAARPDVNASAADGWTPLHAAAAGANTSWSQKEADTLGRIRDLIAAGARLEARDRNGRTPLLWAAMQGYSVGLDVRDGVVKALLEAGADVSTRDALGRTPLHYAAEQGYDEIVSALLAAGARPDAKDNQGATPVDLARNRGLTGTVKLLAGAAAIPKTQPRQATSGKLGPELVAAATAGDLAQVKALLARGADVFYMDSDGFRAVDRARDHGHDDAVTILKAAEQNAPAPAR